MIFDQQGDFDDIGNTPAGRLQRSDQILKRAVNLGFEVVGPFIGDTDLTGDINDVRIRCRNGCLRIAVLRCIREMFGIDSRFQTFGDRNRWSG